MHPQEGQFLLALHVPGVRIGIVSFDPYLKLYTLKLLILPVYKGGTQGMTKSHHLPQVTQLSSSRARSSGQVMGLQARHVGHSTPLGLCYICAMKTHLHQREHSRGHSSLSLGCDAEETAGLCF